MHRDTHIQDTFEREQLMHDNWTYLKNPVRQRWNRLNEDSLEQIDGDHERLLDRIQVAYGIHRELAEEQLQEFMDDYEDYFELVRDRSPSTPIAPRPHI